MISEYSYKIDSHMDDSELLTINFVSRSFM